MPWRGSAPSLGDLAVAAILLYASYAVTPGSHVATDGRPSANGWLVLLIPSALVLPVYTLLSARRRPDRPRGWTAVSSALLCVALLVLTAVVPAVGIGVLCYLGGVLLQQPFRVHGGTATRGRLRPPRGTDNARRDERLRLRRNLHDDVGPALLGIRLQLDTAAHQLAHHPHARQLVAEAAAETRRVVRDLHRIVEDAPGTPDTPPGPLDGARLPDALRRLISRMSSAPVAITLDVPDCPLRLAAATEAAAYRIAAEGLANALRHAAAERIEVRLRADATSVLLEILDDGKGLAPDAARSGGTGIKSLKQRAEAVGGRCTVRPRAGRCTGTAVRAVLPRSAA